MTNFNLTDRSAITASKSVTINTPSYSKPHYTLTAEFTETKTSGNTSTVSVEATLAADQYAAFSGSSNGTLKIYWYDNNEYASGTQIASIAIDGISKNGSKTASGTKIVTHKSDGTLKGYAKAVWDKTSGNNAVPYDKEISTGETALTKTNVAPVFTTNPSVTSVSETSIVINRGVTDVTSTFTYSISPSAGTKTENGAIITYSGLTAGTTYTITVTAINSSATSMTTSKTVSSTTWAWPTISRISTSQLTPGNNQTIYLNNPHGRTVTWYMRSNSTSTNTGGQVSTGTSSGTSITFTPSIDTLFNATNGLGTTKTSINAFYYITYGGNTSSKTGTVAISEANYRPTWGSVSVAAAIKYEDIDSTTISVTGSNQKIVAGKSKIKYKYISNGNEAIANRSTISKYQVSVNGGSYSDLAKDVFKPDSGWAVPSTATGLTISLIAIDARNYKSKPLTLTIADSNFYKYVNPSGTIEVKRLNNYGEQIQLKINPVWAVGNTNANKAKIRFKTSSSSTWTLLNDNYTTFGSLNTIPGTYSNNSTYNFEVVLTDKFNGTSSAILTTIGPGVPIMFIDSTMNSVGFRCFPKSGTAAHFDGPIQKDWYALVGRGGTATTSKHWYKFASCHTDIGYTDRAIIFKVYTGFSDQGESIGELYAHFRTKGDKTIEDTHLQWLWGGENISTANFKMLYYSDTTNGSTVELWVYIPKNYLLYKFIPLAECDREKESVNYWTLYKTTANEGQDSPTSGYTSKDSSFIKLKNSITGNAATATTATNSTSAYRLTAPSGRITSADLAHENPANRPTQRLDLSSSSITTNKPKSNGWIETYFWDNAGAYDSQLFIPNYSTARLALRTRENGDAWPSTWKEIAYYNDIPTLPADSGWKNVPLASGVSAGYVGTPQYRKIGNQVFLRGYYSGSVKETYVNLGTLPIGYRPPKDFRIMMPETGTGYFGRIAITTSGQINLDWFAQFNKSEIQKNTTFSNMAVNTSFWID